jgi:hypothetical protein
MRRHPLRLTAVVSMLAYAGSALAVLWRREGREQAD